MNKKKLSVVMAGAMLASSVAPVLAATESELDTSRLGSLVEKVYDKLTSERFTAGTGDKEAGKSVYGVKIKGEATINAKIDALTVAGKEEELRIALQEAFKDLTADDKVEIWSKGTATDEKRNKSALVDALTAANLVAQTNAPVVLATDKLSDDQIDAIRLRAQKADSLYQVGHGVDRSVMETIASKLGLLNK